MHKSQTKLHSSTEFDSILVYIYMNFVSCGTTMNYGQVNEILKKSINKYLPRDKTANCLTISFFVRQKADIFMSHGCADKNYRSIFKCNYLKQFKYIFVPGTWLKNKLVKLGMDENNIFCVGWPKIDPLFFARKKYLSEKKSYFKSIDRKRGWKPRNKPKILWAPSHNKYMKTSGCSSYPNFNRFYRRLSLNSNIDIRASLHPRNNHNSSITTFELIECDYVIADYGSTIYEAWALGIPVIFPSWLTGKNIITQLPGSAEEYIYSNNIGLHASSYNDLLAKIDFKARPGKRSICKKTKEFMSSYLPIKYNGNSGKTIAKLAIELYEKNKYSDPEPESKSYGEPEPEGLLVSKQSKPISKKNNLCQS